MREYTEKALSSAIEAIRGGLSQRKASECYGIPRSTIQDRLNGAGTHSQAAEPFQRLSTKQEKHLATWILTQDALGVPATHAQLKEFAARILISGGDPQPLGRHWIQGFLSRNPEVKTIRGKRLDSKRLNGASTDAIKEFFALQQNPVIKRIAPQHRYNMDEVGIMEGLGDNGLVLGASEKNTTIRKQSGSRSWTTILECVSATGRALDPLVIFKGKSVQHQWFPDDMEYLRKWQFTASAKGWTDDAIALQWLEEIFIPSTTTTPKTTRLLIVDGHGSHETDDFMYTCYENDIFLLFLPPHASHVLQPLDLSVFSPVKKAYRKELSNHVEADDSTPIGKITFLKCYIKAREAGITISNIKGGWKASGLWPVNMAKALMNPYVKAGRKTPEKAVIEASKEAPEATQDQINTPQRSHQFRALCSRLPSAQAADPTVRLLFRKVAKSLDAQNTKLAESQLKIKRLEQRLEITKPRKKAKVIENPNSRFIKIAEIMETRARLAAQSEAANTVLNQSTALETISEAVATQPTQKTP